MLKGEEDVQNHFKWRGRKEQERIKKKGWERKTSRRYKMVLQNNGTIPYVHGTAVEIKVYHMVNEIRRGG